MVERWIERRCEKSFEIDRSRRNVALTTGCPRFRRLLRLEELDRVAQRFRRQMRVAQRHRKSRMAKQILNRLHGRAFGGELRCERMSKRVPADWLDVGAFAGSLKETERRPVDEAFAVAVEDNIAITIKRFQFLNHVIREWHVSDSSILRSSDVATDIRAADRDRTSTRVYVLPFESGQFRETQTGADGGEDEDAFHVIRARLDDSFNFMLLEKTKRWRCGFELAKARDGFDDAPLNSRGQTFAKHRETVVHRLVAIPALQLLAFVRLDVRRRDLIEFLMAEERDKTRRQDVFL